jgi:hypothetical protein
MGVMISRGRVAVVLGRRGFSAILLAVAGLVFYMVFLAVLATEPSAQTDGDNTGGEVSANQNDQSDGDCPGAEEVEVVTGNGDKQSPVFDIGGNSFRISVDSTATSQDPQVAGVTVFVRPEGNNDEIVADFAVEEGRDDSSIINAGPGRFFLEVLAANAEYTITDCRRLRRGKPRQREPEQRPKQ